MTNENPSLGLPICLNRNCWKPTQNLKSTTAMSPGLPICLNRNCWKQDRIVYNLLLWRSQVYRFV